jgi:hypothetical protein
LSVAITRKIIEVRTYRGWGGYFFEDIDKIRQKFIPTPDRYHTPTDHDRYPFVRTPAPVVGVGIKLDDGSVHWGDGVAVSFGGKAGRAGLGSPDELEKWFKSDFKSWCVGRDVSTWKSLEESFLKAHKTTAPFVRYAVSQAFLSLSINCAKCHNHPLEKWTNDQYYAFANLFSRVRAKGWGGDSRSGNGERTLFVESRGDLLQPRTGRPQPPAPLDGTPLPLDLTTLLLRLLGGPLGFYRSTAAVVGDLCLLRENALRFNGGLPAGGGVSPIAAAGAASKLARAPDHSAST